MIQFDCDVEDFMNYCQLQSLSPKTMKAYEEILFIFGQFLCNSLKIDSAAEVKEAQIKEYIKYLQQFKDSL